MHYLVEDMDDNIKATRYGTGISSIPFSTLKIIFALIFVAIAVVQLAAVF